MMMPGRKYSATSSYRYGFNGKENDNEVKGDGNSIDFGNRFLDTRIGRWFSTDFYMKSYPDVSPYALVGNNPITRIDVMGDFKVKANSEQKQTKNESLKKKL